MSPIPEGAVDAFAYFGAITAGYWVLRLARHFYYYLRPSSLPRYNPAGKDAWAFVTGATDGIGFGFAQELSKKGFNIFLHGRNREKLQQKQAELLAEFPNVKTKIIVFDVTNLTEEVDNIAHEIGNAHLTVLVNNVGGETRPYQRLTELNYKDVSDTVARNTTFVAQITRVLLPILERNGPSLILNISSIASWGLPFVALYGGTKGFVDSFSRAIDAEMKADGKKVEVLALRVGSVHSHSNDVDVGLFIPTSRDMAKAGLNRIGCGLPLIVGYWGHALQTISFDILPRNFLIQMTAKHMAVLKKDYEEKQEKKR